MGERSSLEAQPAACLPACLRPAGRAAWPARALCVARAATNALRRAYTSAARGCSSVLVLLLLLLLYMSASCCQVGASHCDRADPG